MVAIPTEQLATLEAIRLLGAIVVEWSHLEAAIALTYGVLASWENDHEGLALNNSIAVQTFDTVQSSAQKRRILLDSARQRERQSGDLDTLNNLTKRLQNAAAERAQYAHGRWLISDLYPECIIFARNAAIIGSVTVFSKADLQETLSRISALGSDFWRFHFDEMLPYLKGGSVAEQVMEPDIKISH